MAELTVQSERAYLKQPHIFQNPKTAGKSKEKRWFKDVGLGFKTPKEAIEGNYIGIPRPQLPNHQTKNAHSPVKSPFADVSYLVLLYLPKCTAQS
jgi:hypothetical protein